MVSRDLILENEKVLLRPMTRQDFPLLQEITLPASLWTYFTHDLSIPEDFEAWAKPHFAEQRLQFVVFDKEKNRVAGATAFGNFSPRDSRLEIGWTWLGKDFHGSGINREMKGLMLDYCFNTLDLERVEIKTDVLNQSARKALIKLGAKEEGILRSHTQMILGRRRDTIYYSFLKGEWPAEDQ